MTPSQALEAHENRQRVMFANNFGLNYGRIVDIDIVDGEPADVAAIALEGTLAVVIVAVEQLFVAGWPR